MGRETRVANEPAKDVAAVVGHQFPGLHDDAHSASDEAAGAEANTARRKFEKSFAGETTLAATLTLRVAISKAIMANDRERIAKAREDGDGVPERLAKMMRVRK